MSHSETRLLLKEESHGEGTNEEQQRRQKAEVGQAEELVSEYKKPQGGGGQGPLQAPGNEF